MEITKFTLVMAAMLLADVCWTLYFIYTEKRAMVKAGIWSALIILVSSFATTEYVQNRLYVIPAMLGAFLGTVGIIYWKKKQEAKNEKVVIKPDCIMWNAKHCNCAACVRFMQIYYEQSVRYGETNKNKKPLVSKAVFSKSSEPT